MNIYVTGGTGFIGSYVVKELSKGQHNIVVLARNPEKTPKLSSLPGVTVKKADMYNEDALKRQYENNRPGRTKHSTLREQVVYPPPKEQWSTPQTRDHKSAEGRMVRNENYNDLPSQTEVEKDVKAKNFEAMLESLHNSLSARIDKGNW